MTAKKLLGMMCQENVPEEKYMELLSKIQAGLQTAHGFICGWNYFLIASVYPGRSLRVNCTQCNEFNNDELKKV